MNANISIKACNVSTSFQTSVHGFKEIVFGFHVGSQSFIVKGHIGLLLGPTSATLSSQLLTTLNLLEKESSLVERKWLM